MVAACFFIIVLLIALLVRDRPSEMGLRPVGEGYIPPKNKKDSNDHWDGFTMAELRKKPAFYLMIVGNFLASGCVFMGFHVVSPFVQDCGMNAEFAASAQSLMLLGLGVYKLLFGYLSDRVGAKWLTLTSLVALVAAMLLLANVKGETSVYIAVLVFAISQPLTIMAPTLLIPSLFGYQSSTKAIGIILAMSPASNMLATPLTNTLRDALGSYRPVFRGTALVAIVVLVIYFMVYVLAVKDRKELEQQKIV